jgi:hypothetical protein
MEAVCFSETLAPTDESTRRQNPEEEHHLPYRHENLKSKFYLFSEKKVSSYKNGKWGRISR